jgi:hypothetical protein
VVHHAIILELTGPSFRADEAESRETGEKKNSKPQENV